MQGYILWLDDDVGLIGRVLKELLEREIPGYEVINFSDVDNAWEFVQANRQIIKCAILDLIMEGGRLFGAKRLGNYHTTGIQFFRKLRELLPGMPVIFFTVVSDIEKLRPILDKPRTIYLTKPELARVFTQECARFFRKTINTASDSA